MRYTIENEFLKAEADTAVGELRGIMSKKTGKDYLWKGDPKHWAYCAPMLFPIVCAATDDIVKVDGVEYNMPKHGFVRSSEFTLVEHTADTMVFELRDSAETLKMYPFKFILRFRYKLRGNAVVSELEVENIDNQTIYFSAGGHPALMCPFNQDEAFSDYYLEFDENETLDTAGFDGMYLNGSRKFLVGEKRIPMDYAALTETLILNNYRSEGISLRSKKSDNYVRMNIKGFPWVGIWTITDPGAPYICVEPWYGIPDVSGFRGEMKDKKGIVALEAGKTFSCCYTIEVFE